MVETNNGDVTTKIAHNATKGFMSLLICQLIGEIIGCYLGQNPTVRRWCSDHKTLSEFLRFISTFVAAVYPSNKLLRVGLWIFYATPKVILSTATDLNAILIDFVISFQYVFAIYLVHFKLSDYTLIFAFVFWNLLAYVLGIPLVPHYLTWTAGISFGLFLVAYFVILLNTPSKHLDIPLLPALKLQLQMFKRRWRSYIISLSTIRILGLVGISAAMKSLDLVSAATTAIFFEPLWLPSPFHTSIALSFAIVLINAKKPAALINLVEYGSIASEAFMIGIPLANVPFDMYLFMVTVPIAMSYLTAMFSEDFITFAWQIVLLWSCFGCGLYCTLDDSHFTDKLSYILLFGLYILLRLSSFIRDQRTDNQNYTEWVVDEKVVRNVEKQENDIQV